MTRSTIYEASIHEYVVMNTNLASMTPNMKEADKLFHIDEKDANPYVHLKATDSDEDSGYDGDGDTEICSVDITGTIDDDDNTNITGNEDGDSNANNGVGVVQFRGEESDGGHVYFDDESAKSDKTDDYSEMATQGLWDLDHQGRRLFSVYEQVDASRPWAELDETYHRSSNSE